MSHNDMPDLKDRLRLTSLKTWHVRGASDGFYRDDSPFEAADRIEELEHWVVARRSAQAVADAEYLKVCGLLEEATEALGEMLSHDDLCLLSRIFNTYSAIGVDQYIRINGWLKGLIAGAATAGPEGLGVPQDAPKSPNSNPLEDGEA